MARSAGPEGRPPASVDLAVVITHPHPSYGGTMDVPVVQAMFERAVNAGCVAVMFNFRGAGGSTGRHDHGDAEQRDVAAAIDAAVALAPGAPVLLAGYSFGAGVALQVTDERVLGWFMIAPQARPDMAAGSDPRMKRFVVPEHDQYCSPDDALAAVVGWAATEIIELTMADHFLAGAAARAADHLTAMIAEVTAS